MKCLCRLKKFFFYTSFLSSVVAMAATPIEIQHIQNKLNDVFQEQIFRSGNKKISIYLDPSIPKYPGGVNLVNDEIRVIIGSTQATQYSLGALQFIVCHELGHILGGPPYKTEKNGRQYKNKLISAEGQSDYWAGKECLPHLTAEPIQAASAFFSFLSASLQDLVKDNPFYATPAYGVIDDYFYDAEYPSFQCRFNSVVAGVEGHQRPGCWFPTRP